VRAQQGERMRRIGVLTRLTDENRFRPRNAGLPGLTRLRS
jgi:hypothetical protein